jgi:OmpA-OmpF porin, OOP family
LDDVLFDFDRAVVKPDARLILDRLVTFLQENPGRTVQLSGYTDSIGTEQYNLGLSLRRAKAVERYILQRTAEVGATGGFTIIAEGFGEANPIASNANAQGRAQNRRVEVVVP